MIYHTALYRLLNSLEHCIYTTLMTNIRPGRDSNQVPLSFEPQPDQMSHRGRPDFAQALLPQTARHTDPMYRVCWVDYLWLSVQLFQYITEMFRM